MDEDEQEEELDDDVEEEEEEVMMNGSGGTTAEGRSRMGSDSPMLIGSPSFDGPLPLPLLPGSLFAPTVGGNGRTTGGRSRTPSESFGSTNAGGMNTIGGGGGGVPPASPVAIARALQGGQRTPPPFLNRPLFNGMREDHDLGGGGERGSRRESSNSSGDDGAQLEGIGGGGLGLAGTSGSSGGEESGRTGVVRRPVSRRPNLLVRCALTSLCRFVLFRFAKLTPASLSLVFARSPSRNLIYEFSPTYDPKPDPTSRKSCPKPPSIDSPVPPLPQSLHPEPRQPHPPSHFPPQT